VKTITAEITFPVAFLGDSPDGYAQDLQDQIGHTGAQVVKVYGLSDDASEPNRGDADVEQRTGGFSAVQGADPRGDPRI
jgi:hypothetical protein